jgi:hypothetical protein
MLLRQLIARLERLQEQHGGDVEVRIAIPRSWPLVARVGDVRYLDDEVDPDSVRRVVWISGE